MRLETERASAIHGHDFVDAVAIQKPAIEGRDPCFLQRHEHAIQIADGKGIGHENLTASM
jgi:hypothetical protein